MRFIVSVLIFILFSLHVFGETERAGVPDSVLENIKNAMRQRPNSKDSIEDQIQAYLYLQRNKPSKVPEHVLENIKREIAQRHPYNFTMQKELFTKKVRFYYSSHNIKPPSESIDNAYANNGAAIKSIEPPFEWDDTFATHGTSLTIEEKMRLQLPKNMGTLIRYKLRLTGFSAQEPISLWWKRGTVYNELAVTLSGEGHIQILGADDLVIDDLAISSYVPGQALDLAIVSKTTDKRSHAKVIPFPVQAQGDGVCSASAEIASESGLLFVFSLRGFQPGEEVQLTSLYKGETKMMPSKASERGEILGLPVLFERGSSGKATLTAKGKNCTVSLDYNIGKDALVVQ